MRIETKEDLAKALKRHRGTVTRWTQRPDWPFGEPPWGTKKSNRIELIRHWVAQLQDDRAQDDADPRAENIRDLPIEKRAGQRMMCCG